MSTAELRGMGMALLSLLILTGCSTMEIRSDFDPAARFTELKRYAWMPPAEKTLEEGDPRVADPDLDRHIQSAVDTLLAERGFSSTGEDQADFLVGYHVAIASQLEVMRMNEQYGYAPGWGWHGYLHSEDPGYRKFGWGWSPSESYVRKFNQGSLVIDIVDANPTNLIWRGSAEAEIHDDRKPEEQYLRVEKAVRKILKDFPPTQPR